MQLAEQQSQMSRQNDAQHQP